jgi:hypothetical protein
MHNLNKLIREALKSRLNEHDCGCGCSGKCGGDKAPMINENLIRKPLLSENLQYHVDNKKPLTENTFRYGSEAFLSLWSETRKLYSRNLLEVSGLDKDIITETDLGEYGVFEGQKVPLDLPLTEGEVNEAEYKGKDVQLNKPKRGGSKKFFVYVMDPKTKRVKKVSFGAAGGGQNLAVKIRDPKARKAFAARQNCDKKKDRTKPGYWSCNIGRYWKSLGGGSNFSGYW